MEQSKGKWTIELELIANIIRKAPLQVITKWGVDVYTYKGKNVLSYGGFKHFCSIWFYNGVFLKDKLGVLVTATEGKTKSLRQWRFKAIEEIQESQIFPYLLEAIAVAKKGLKIKSAKDEPIDIPAVLQAFLENDVPLSAAFNKLSRGKQKEYANFISEAKQEATKLKRLDKIIPMIISGIGLNNKYK